MGLRNTIVTCLELEGYQPEAVASTHEAMERLKVTAYPIVISDIYLDERTGIDVLRAARLKNPACAVILMTGRGSMETVMAATEGGAFEYLAKPFEMAQMIETIRRAEKSLGAAEDENDAAPIDDLPDTEMIGSSPRMIEIYKTLSRVAPTDATVLIEGETGTGKELAARAVHAYSVRRFGPFRVVDCAMLSEAAAERELFGPDGAFTTAQGGMIFFDESTHETSLRQIARNFRRLGLTTEDGRYIVDGPHFVKSHNTRCVQFADHIAYSVFRYFHAQDNNYLNVVLNRMALPSVSTDC